MLTLPPSVRIYLATEPVDLRRGHDGLFAMVRNQWRMDPFAGHLFAFVEWGTFTGRRPIDSEASSTQDRTLRGCSRASQRDSRASRERAHPSLSPLRR